MKGNIKAKISLEQRKIIMENYVIPDVYIEKVSVAKVRNGEVKITLTPGELEDFIGYIAAEANHAENKNIQDILNDLCDYLESLESR